MKNGEDILRDMGLDIKQRVVPELFYRLQMNIEHNGTHYLQGNSRKPYIYYCKIENRGDTGFIINIEV